MRKFASVLSNDLVLECKGAMLNRDMDFSKLSVNIQQIKDQKKKKVAEIREKDGQAKRARLEKSSRKISVWRHGNVGVAKSQTNSSAPPLPPQGASSATKSCRNQLYALINRQEAEVTSNVVTGTLQIFYYDVYVLLDPSSALSYVTQYMAVDFGFEPDVITETFSVCTL
ncbi:uncharacterized protein LOC124894305, partial [Capsicum annuum]|uniref:uncharacterized protein LOC124894305 n=1 Tax=Capsicum annuum TaxID=4072 RepID=UPI001FB1352E